MIECVETGQEPMRQIEFLTTFFNGNTLEPDDGGGLSIHHRFRKTRTIALHSIGAKHAIPFEAYTLTKAGLELVEAPRREHESASAKAPRMKRPKDWELRAWVVAKSTNLNQTTIAAHVGKGKGQGKGQGQVSKALARVEKWLAEGNVMPQLTAPAHHTEDDTITVDPWTLDMGERGVSSTQEKIAGDKIRDEYDG